MPGKPREMIVTAERRFPVRIRGDSLDLDLTLEHSVRKVQRRVRV